MRPAIARKLAEVEASYREPHRCGLYTCQEIGECGFPTRCCALSSDLSDDGNIPSTAGWRPVNTDDMLDPMHPGEYAWRAEGHDNGWSPPERRSWWKRLPVIRHIAAIRLSWKVHTYAGAWADVGVGLGGPNPRDLWVVEGAYHGFW